ncbi:MAG: DUF3015 family protein [Kangiellaceae bacterium]|nr:DUF3015 family protein [Kangiellaceae bacterium]
MKTIVKTLAATSLVLMSATSTAESGREGVNLYSDCGIGAALFPTAPVGAVISNIIWDVGTTATSTFISSPESCVDRSAQVVTLINDAYQNIEEETAIGAGAHITAMLDIMECDAAVRKSLTSDIRDDFKLLVSASDYAEQTQKDKTINYFDTVANNVKANYSKSCNLS